MPERRVVLAVNEAFYEAFRGRDVDAMEELWAESAQVSCIHPGRNPLFGRAAVLESWQAILADPNAPQIVCRNARAVMQDQVALVICHEQIDDHFLVATNIFRKENGEWRMVHHQAAGSPAPPFAENDEGSGVLQ